MTSSLTTLSPGPTDDDGSPIDVAVLAGQLQETRISYGKRMIPIIRVSKVAGRAGEGFIAPEEQRRKIEAYAARHGCEILDEYNELDTSGGKIDRAALDAALADVMAGKADGIIVAYLSRYARTTAGLGLVRKLQKAGKAFVSVDEGIGPEMLQTSFGWFTFTIMLAVAELQLGILTEQFNSARRVHIGAGIAAKVPYGYRKRVGGDPEAEDARLRPRRLEPDPLTAEHVRFIFEQRAAGGSWITIARALDERGVTPPGGGACWLHNRVHHIVKNRAYLGELTSGDFVNPKAHLPLVTVDLWDQANNITQTPARRGRSSYLLTGLLRCATCGGRMCAYAQSMKSGKKHDGPRVRYYYYRCRRRYSWGMCPKPANIRVDTIDAHVTEEFRRLFASHLVDDQRADDRSADLAAAQRAIDDAAAALDLFLGSPATSRTAARLGPQWYEEQVERLNDDLETAQEAWQTIRNDMTGLTLPRGMAENWSSYALDEQRLLLSSAIGVIAVRPAGRTREPIADRVRVWVKNEPGSPEATLPRRGSDVVSAMVPIDF